MTIASKESLIKTAERAGIVIPGQDDMTRDEYYERLKKELDTSGAQTAKKPADEEPEKEETPAKDRLSTKRKKQKKAREHTGKAHEFKGLESEAKASEKATKTPKKAIAPKKKTSPKKAKSDGDTDKPRPKTKKPVKATAKARTADELKQEVEHEGKTLDDAPRLPKKAPTLPQKAKTPKKKASPKKKPADIKVVESRARGAIVGFWVILFEENADLYAAGNIDGMKTDEQITESLREEFDKTSAVFSQVPMVRSRYHRGVLTGGAVPARMSPRYVPECDPNILLPRAFRAKKDA